MNRIYLVTRRDRIGYYEYAGFVVVAPSYKKAEQHANKHGWGDASSPEIVANPIGVASKKMKEGIIFDSYVAG